MCINSGSPRFGPEIRSLQSLPSVIGSGEFGEFYSITVEKVLCKSLLVALCILHVVMILMYRLQLWYDKVKEEGASEGYAFASYCGFCAEIFAKIKAVLV